MANNSEVSKVLDSFFAGCLKYDIYDLAKRYRQFTLKDIFDTVSYLDDEEIETVIDAQPDENVDGDPVVINDYKVPSGTTSATTATTATTSATTATTASTVTEFNLVEPIVYFRNDYPDPKTTNETTTKNIKDLWDDYKTKRYSKGAFKT